MSVFGACSVICMRHRIYLVLSPLVFILSTTSCFPPNLQSNVARFQEYGNVSGASATPTLTPTASGSALGQHRNEDTLVNGFSSMAIGSNLGPNGGSPRRLREF